MRKAWALCAAVVVLSAVLLADDHSVIFDEDVDFSTFKTFTMADASVTSERPELKFPVVARTLGEAVRSALALGGLKETSAPADLVVECRVTGVDYNIGPFGRPNAITSGRGGRGGRAGAGPVDFTEITMVIDLSRANPSALLWRGVYHDTENDARLLAEALPKDATKLLAQYPPKRKK